LASLKVCDVPWQIVAGEPASAVGHWAAPRKPKVKNRIVTARNGKRLFIFRWFYRLRFLAPYQALHPSKSQYQKNTTPVIKKLLPIENKCMRRRQQVTSIYDKS
jgi:hypothetical protein